MGASSPSPTPGSRRRAALAALLSSVLAASLVMVAGLWLSPRPPLMGDTPGSKAYYDRHGALLRLELAADDRYRLFTPLEQVPLALIQATLLQEDRYFRRHPGVNPFSLLRGAFETFVRRTRPVGGSTLSMQLVRLRDRLDTRTVTGKLIQIWRALVLERHYSKARILEAYLNLAPYGGNIEGVGAAARIYFGRPPQELALPQCLALAVIPQNPVGRRPGKGDNPLWRAARLRLYQRYAARYPQPPASQALMQLPLTVRDRGELPFRAPHFINGLGATLTSVVNSALDLPLQTLLERQIRDHVREHARQGVDNAAAMLVHFPSLEVLALVGSADFFNGAIDGQVDGTAAPRSPGSTLKSLVYALALEQGLIHPGTLLQDAPAAFAEYRPANFDHRFLGRIPATEALQLSRNVPAIALSARLAEPDLYGFLKQAGVRLPRDRGHYGLSLTVGGAEVPMRDLVALYAMLANGGLQAPLRYLASPAGKGPARPLLSPEAAYLTLLMLEHPDPRGETPFGAPAPALPVYWKTGTSSGMRDAWTVGVFGPYVLAVWVGHFDGRRNPVLVGNRIAAPLFFRIADRIIADQRPADLVHPALEHLNVTRLALCRDIAKDCGLPSETLYIPGRSPISVPWAIEAPEIISPQPGIRYALSGNPEVTEAIPLEARFSNPEYPLFWFAGQRLLGVSEDGSPLFWNPRPGQHVIRVLDTAGHGATTTIQVAAAR